MEVKTTKETKVIRRKPLDAALGCLVGMTWLQTQVDVDEETVGYIFLPPLKRKIFHRWPDPQMMVYSVNTNDIDIRLLSAGDVGTLRVNSRLGTKLTGVIIKLSDPTVHDRWMASACESFRAALVEDMPIPLSDVPDRLEAVLKTYPSSRERAFGGK